VARRAKPWVIARFLGVSCVEAGAMETREADIVEREPGRQRGDRAHTMAGRAGALAMATRTEVPSARRPHAVFAHPVAIVDKVVLGQRTLRGEVDMATVAIAQCPLVAVLVATEAARHLRQDGLRRGLGDFDVTAYAVAPDREHVS
jgi:hypothetical protein